MRAKLEKKHGNKIQLCILYNGKIYITSIKTLQSVVVNVTDMFKLKIIKNNVLPIIVINVTTFCSKKNYIFLLMLQSVVINACYYRLW